MRQKISEALNAKIQQEGLTLYQLSRMSGVQQTHLNRFISGDKNYTVDLASKVLDALGFEVKIVSKRKSGQK